MGALDELMRPPENPATPYNQGVRNVLHELFVQPVKQAGQALQGRMTENEAQNFALEAMAGLIPMGRGLRAAKGIRAYHGSPHDFDRFDMSKIGTGEGAQAYGHGLYFAENPEVAGAYRDALTQRMNPLEKQFGRFLTGADDNAPGMMYPEGLDLHMLKGIGNDRKGFTNAELLDAARKNLAQVQGGKGPLAAANRERAQRTVAYLEANPTARIVGSPYEGRMYEVNINAHPDQFLDWDKPLSKQPQAAQDLARDVINRPGARGFVADADRFPLTGQDLHNAIAGDLRYNASYNSQPLARASEYPMVSDRMREAGIPGIKYLDQGSRTAGEGSRNYVVFDDKLIDILRKYGLAGLMSGTAVSAAKGPLEQLMEGQ